MTQVRLGDRLGDYQEKSSQKRNLLKCPKSNGCDFGAWGFVGVGNIGGTIDALFGRVSVIFSLSVS